jgi:hypothetical protein
MQPPFPHKKHSAEDLSSRRLVVRHHDRIIADTKRLVALYESGFAPRWYVERADFDESALTPVEHQTFCPYKGLCRYYDIGDARLATGRILTPTLRSAGSAAWYRSSQILSPYNSMAPSFALSRVRQ